MRKLIPLIALAFLIGCASQSKNIYNTLSTIQISTSSAYNAYLDLVVQGKLATNSVPTVSRDYTTFQMAWTAAVSVASGGVNNPPTQPVTEAAAKVIADIAAAKGKP